MNINNPASANQSDYSTLTGTLRLVLTKFLQSVDDMLPAQVIAYDRATNTAQVQPLINVITTNNITVQRAQISSVPVLQLGGGGFVLSFPINTGDLGWIKANDRDISIFKQTYEASPPNTQRKHSFSDAVFIPDTMLQNVTVASGDDDNAVLQNYTGTVRVSLGAGGIGINGSPVSGCALAITSTTQAFRPPVMTTSQKLAIPSPSIGMTVYDSTELGISTYNGTTWS